MEAGHLKGIEQKVVNLLQNVTYLIPSGETALDIVHGRDADIRIEDGLHDDEKHVLGLLQFDGVDTVDFNNKGVRILDEVAQVIPEM